MNVFDLIEGLSFMLVAFILAIYARFSVESRFKRFYEIVILLCGLTSVWLLISILRLLAVK